MKELDKLVENYFTEKKAPELGMDMLLEMVEQSLEEAIYYDKDGDGVVDMDDPDLGPYEVEQVAEFIIKYIKRKFPENYGKAELTFQGGKRVLHFTNFGSLATRDRAIKDLVKVGWVKAGDAQIKRSKLFHRAITKYFDRYDYKDPSKPPKLTPLEIQFNSGGGPAAAGAQHEDEVAGLLTQGSEDIGREGYQAYKEGGATALPDVILYDGPREESGSSEIARFETKTVASADFGQFQIQRNSRGFSQKTQTDSPTLVSLFKRIKRRLGSICNYDPQKSGDLMNIPLNGVGGLIERYYEEKRVDYIIVKDDIYAANEAAAQRSGLPRFKDSVSKRGYVRVRVKCHGKSYSTTVGIKIDPL